MGSKKMITPMCKVKIAEAVRYAVRIQASLLSVVQAGQQVVNPGLWDGGRFY